MFRTAYMEVSMMDWIQVPHQWTSGVAAMLAQRLPTKRNAPRVAAQGLWVLVQTHIWALSRVDPDRPPADEMKRAAFIGSAMAPLLVTHLRYPESATGDVLAAMTDVGAMLAVDGGHVVEGLERRYLPTFRRRWETRRRVRGLRAARAAGWRKEGDLWVHPPSGRSAVDWQAMLTLLERTS